MGCLYHDVLPARDASGNPGVMVRSTGAVWFTLRMHIQPDGINPQTDWDCAEPIVELVGDVALAAMTGGVGAATAAPKFVAKQVAKEAIKAAVKKSVKELAKNGAKQIGQYLVENGSISMGGQYAGYDWPLRCDAMPEYHVTGGPKEYNAQGAATFTFAETGRDDWSVYLVDRSRNVEIQLDVFRKMIGYAAVGQPRQDLYRITGWYRQ